MSYIRMIVSVHFMLQTASAQKLFLLTRAAKVQSNKRALPLSLFDSAKKNENVQKQQPN
jgi:hypothetical protein